MADTELTLSRLLKRHFRTAAQDDAASALITRTRIDARTVGYPDEHDASKVIWHGMTPVRGDDANDLWRLMMVEESRNKYLSHISAHERLVKIKYTDEAPMPFQKAMERLAVWELARMMKGATPLSGQGRHDLAEHYFRDLAMRRGFIFDSIGNMTAIPDILPEDSGKFLKSDLEAIRHYRGELQGADKLDQLMSAQANLYVLTRADEDEQGSIQDDLESFGEIALFEQMQFFAEILVEYARVQLSYIQEFYGHPERFAAQNHDKQTLAKRMNHHALFFNQDLIDRINHTRAQFAETIFKYFHVAEEDWDHELDFTSRAMRKQLMINPDAKETHEFMTREISFPLDSRDTEQILFIAARSLMFCSTMLQDSPQKDRLERKGLYKSGDIKDLLNFLDLLDVKYLYTELAENATALPHTQRYADLKAQNASFSARVDYLIANLKESADWSPAQEAQIQDFIKAKSEVYLLDKIKDLPVRLAAAHRFLSDMLLPRPHQLSLGLDVPETDFKAAPTRRSAAKKDNFWTRLTRG
ncbi:MAG: hypothetical protein H6867_11690 [Rhodospirillales bacterium]|nr:hypothetical protein [Rhodospirillales bacterium]